MASINIDPKKISSLAAKAFVRIESRIAETTRIIEKIEKPKNKKGTWAYFFFGSGVGDWDAFPERARKNQLQQKQNKVMGFERLAETAIENDATVSITNEELAFLEQWAGEKA